MTGIKINSKNLHLKKIVFRLKGKKVMGIKFLTSLKKPILLYRSP
jgi:hypothetical protein